MKSSLIELEAIIKSLDEHIMVTRSQNLSLTTQLLAMAKLNLQMTLHEITDQELQELCGAADAEYASMTIRTVRPATCESGIGQSERRLRNPASSDHENGKKDLPPGTNSRPDNSLPGNQRRRSAPRSRGRS